MVLKIKRHPAGTQYVLRRLAARMPLSRRKTKRIGSNIILSLISAKSRSSDIENFTEDVPSSLTTMFSLHFALTNDSRRFIASSSSSKKLFFSLAIILLFIFVILLHNINHLRHNGGGIADIFVFGNFYHLFFHPFKVRPIS